MEKREWIEGGKRVFTQLVRDTIWEDFTMPNGGSTDRYIGECYDKLVHRYGTVSVERLVDFCIRQVYAISRFHNGYRKHWNVSHSFSKKAITRYIEPTKQIKIHEDRWLNCYGVSRIKYLSMIEDRSKHPLSIFIYPQYEEQTKRRWASEKLGYIICWNSTMMWTPFSPTCQICINAELCRMHTERVHHELYRIRCEAWAKQELE